MGKHLQKQLKMQLGRNSYERPIHVALHEILALPCLRHEEFHLQMEVREVWEGGSVSAEYDLDVFYHALNYRGAASHHADFHWHELEACVNRLVTLERHRVANRCAEICEEHATIEGIAQQCADAIRNEFGDDNAKL